MLRVFAENENNDLFFNDKGQIEIIQDQDALVQITRSRVETQRGEVYFDVNKGVPTEQTLWRGTPDLQAFELEVRRVLLNIVDVVEILDFEAEQINDVVEYTAILRTTFGTTTITNSFFT